MAGRKKFGEILVDAGVLTEQNLQLALAKQQGTKKHLGQVLEEHGIVTEQDIAIVLAKQFQIKVVRNIAGHQFAPEVLAVSNGDTVLNKLIFPLRIAEKKLFLAMVNPLDMETIDDISFRTGMRVVPCVTTRAEIVAAAKRHYLNEAEGASDGGPWTVLVVDDQELVRSAIVAALERDGYRVLQASDGAEGLKTALQDYPHLIVSDTVMPRMTGDQMFRTLQSNSRTQKIPVIGLSSKSAPEEEARMLELGYFDFIAKPIHAVRLQARVKRALKAVYGEVPPPRL